MALVLSVSDIAKTHGSRRLFSGLSLGVEEDARLGLIGPNGSGKTTLLEILAGVQSADEGERSIRKLARMGYVPQDSRFEDERTVFGVVDGSLDDSGLDEAERSVRVSVALSKAGFESEDLIARTLSGGWKKRLSVAAELVREPDVLLLDEPTNHLDLDGIAWLERLLKTERLAAVFVSHDRYFLENVASELADVNPAYPGGVFRASGSYSQFLEKREAHLENQSRQRETLANLVKTEIEWLRRGPKARTGKSRARIDKAHEMISSLDEMQTRARTGTAAIDFTASDRKTKRLIEAEGISKTLGDRKLFQDLDVLLAPGVRLGVLGPNGSGKTTLLRTLLGDMEPDQGTVSRANAVRIVKLDQHRTALDEKMPLKRALCPDGDSVMYRGEMVHVVAWAKRFLFQVEQLELPVSELSGGERARVAVAELMRQEADVLALDEPTNDLDIPTLEVLEQNLLDFPGAMLLITHDRYLLDRVATSVIGLDGDGDAAVYADYRQWETARAEKRKRSVSSEPIEKSAAVVQAKPKKKLSYKDQVEWDGMEQKILEAEEELAAATVDMENPENASDAETILSRAARLEKAQASVDALYERWSALEEKLA